VIAAVQRPEILLVRGAFQGGQIDRMKA